MEEKLVITQNMWEYTNGVLFGTCEFLKNKEYGTLNPKDYIKRNGFIEDANIKFNDGKIYLLNSGEIETKMGFHKNLEELIRKTFFLGRSKKGEVVCYIEDKKIVGFRKAEK